MLHALLLDLFSSSDLRHWLKDGPEREVLSRLPGEPVSPDQLIDETIDELQRHGLIDEAFFHRLLAARHRRAAEIREVAARWFPSFSGADATRVPITPTEPRPQVRPTTAAEGPPLTPFALSYRRSSAMMSLLLVVSAGWIAWSMLHASHTPTRLPPPFGADDRGIEEVWNAGRRATLTTAVEAGPAPLRAAWPVLLHALEAHAAVWRRSRELGREKLLSGPNTQIHLSGLCLQDALARLEHVLKSVEDAASQETAPRWEHLRNQWRLDLMPPTRCTDPQFLESLAAQVGGSSLEWSGGDPSWRVHELAGYHALVAGDEGLARYHYSRILADPDGTPSTRGYAHIRLAGLALQRDDKPAASTHVESAIELAAEARDTFLQFYATVWSMNLAANSNDGPGASYRALYRSARGLLGGTAARSDRWLRAELAKLDVQMAWSIAKSAEQEERLASCPIECNEEIAYLPSCATGAVPTHAACARDLLTLAEGAAPDDDNVRMNALRTRASLALTEGDNGAARRHADALLRLPSSTNTSAESEAYAFMAHAALNTGDDESAESFFRLALGRLDALEAGQTTDALDPLVNLATLAHARGAYPDAISASERARQILLRNRMPAEDLKLAIIVHAVLSDLYLGPQKTRDDLAGYDRAVTGLELGRATPDATSRGFLSHIRVALARLGLRRAETSFAATQLERAKELGSDLDPEFLAGQDWLRAELALMRGDDTRARQLLEAASNALSGLTHPPARHLTLHLDWLRARLHRARDAEGQRLVASLQLALAANQYFIDEFLDPSTLKNWLTTRQGSDRTSHGNEK